MLKLKNFRRASLSLVVLLLALGLVACGADTDPEQTTPAAASGASIVQVPTDAEPAVLPSNGVTKLDWFEFKEAAQANWILTPDPNDKLRATIYAKDRNRFEGQEKRVMVIFTKAGVAFNDSMTTLLSVFMERKVRGVFTLVNIKYNPTDAAPDTSLGKKALEYAIEKKYDLVLPMGSDAAIFAHENFRGGPIPTVMVLSKDPVLLKHIASYDSKSGTNIAYTSVNVPIEVLMLYLLQLRPELKNIAILYEKTNKGAIETQVEPMREPAKVRNINILDVAVEDPKKAQEELALKVPEAVAKLQRTDPTWANSIFLVTGSDTVKRSMNTINQGAGRVPVVTVAPEWVEEGDDSPLLGIGVSFETATRLAAVYGVDILQGKVKPGELKVGLVSPPDIAINFKKARQIGLKIPFNFFESATFVYDTDGKAVRKAGQNVK